MKHLPKITLTGALLLTVASASFAENQGDMLGQKAATDSTGSSSQMDNQNSTGNLQGQTGSSSNGATTPQSSSSNQMAKGKNTSTVYTPDNIQWQDAPKMLPTGAQFAVLEGNLKSKGNITVRFKLPNNYQVQPASFQVPQRITVLSGTLNLGMGDKFDTTAGTALPAGSFVVIPANKHHYVWTSEDTVVQVSGNGPWNVKYVNAKDDPRKNKAAGQGQNSQPGQGNDQPSGTTSPSSSSASSSSAPSQNQQSNY